MSTFIDGDLDPARAYYLLKMQDAAQRGFADAWHQPRWIKFRADGDFVFMMIWMNRACADRFYGQCPPQRVIGHCDRACHSDERSAHYALTDQKAVDRSGQVIDCDEPDPNGGTVRVRKFAYRVDSDGLRGWFVYGECPDEPKQHEQPTG
jgi:hypothetical protein